MEKNYLPSSLISFCSLSLVIVTQAVTRLLLHFFLQNAEKEGNETWDEPGKVPVHTKGVHSAHTSVLQERVYGEVFLHASDAHCSGHIILAVLPKVFLLPPPPPSTLVLLLGVH